jgi:uncharacterized protein (TIGR03000 family)
MRQPAKGSTILAVSVPQEAKVYVNGMLTKTPGAYRRYISRGLTPGLQYTYEIRAELERDGKSLSDSRLVQVRAGDTTQVAFDFAADASPVAAAPVSTTLTLHVPKDARVNLAGNETASSGEVRQFTTTQLAHGEKWEDYRIVVTVNRDGRELRRERTLSLTGGQSRELSFHFTDQSLALR